MSESATADELEMSRIVSSTVHSESQGSAISTGSPVVVSGSSDVAGKARADIAATFTATLVDEWARLGLRDVMIVPVPRDSTPMSLAFWANDEINVHIHHDERSTSFMAIGSALANRRPVAILCTSGTAATEFHSAVVEADLARVPLLVLTADRPPNYGEWGRPRPSTRSGSTAILFAGSAMPRCLGVRTVATGVALPDEHGTRAWGPHPDLYTSTCPFREPLVGEPGEYRPREPDWRTSDPSTTDGQAVDSEEADLPELQIGSVAASPRRTYPPSSNSYPTVEE